MDKHSHRLMNTYDYEDALFKISPRLRLLRDWKELYIQFNSKNAGNPMKAGKEIGNLIKFYSRTNDKIFTDFAELLTKYRDPIINSFVMVEKHGPRGIYNSRLSNGPMESLNRKVKDLRRMGRGYRNFEHLRNRFLFATRNNPPLSSPSNKSSFTDFDDDDQEV